MKNGSTNLYKVHLLSQFYKIITILDFMQEYNINFGIIFFSNDFENSLIGNNISRLKTNRLTYIKFIFDDYFITLIEIFNFLRQCKL